jgi:hypothetical protein
MCMSQRSAGVVDCHAGCGPPGPQAGPQTWIFLCTAAVIPRLATMMCRFNSCLSSIHGYAQEKEKKIGACDWSMQSRLHLVFSSSCAPNLLAQTKGQPRKLVAQTRFSRVAFGAWRLRCSGVWPRAPFATAAACCALRAALPWPLVAPTGRWCCRAVTLPRPPI